MSEAPLPYWQELLATRTLPAAAADDPLACAYLDFAAPAGVVLGHLGQSLDGQIATASGDGQGVTGAANIRHLHRLRALADAVLVGAATVRNDDPLLTTRLVDGPSPVRVVLDGARRLGPDHRLFQEGPPTLVLCAATAADRAHLGRAEIVPVPGDAAGLRPAAVLAALRARGLRRVFIEGGGVTVGRFLEAGCLDLLEVCVAPVLIGTGRPGLRGPTAASMAEALRPAGTAIPMGRDVLFHLRLRGAPDGFA